MAAVRLNEPREGMSLDEEGARKTSTRSLNRPPDEAERWVARDEEDASLLPKLERPELPRCTLPAEARPRSPDEPGTMREDGVERELGAGAGREDTRGGDWGAPGERNPGREDELEPRDGEALGLVTGAGRWDDARLPDERPVELLLRDDERGAAGVAREALRGAAEPLERETADDGREPKPPARDDPPLDDRPAEPDEWPPDDPPRKPARPAASTGAAEIANIMQRPMIAVAAVNRPIHPVVRESRAADPVYRGVVISALHPAALPVHFRGRCDQALCGIAPRTDTPMHVMGRTKGRCARYPPLFIRVRQIGPRCK